MNYERQDGDAVFQNLSLERMFYRQKQVMKRLIDDSKLPPFPYDINQKENQQHFRSLHGFLVEELFEFKEAYSKLVEYVEQPENKLDSEILLELLASVNQEYSDVLAFAFELLIYAGITEDDIRLFVKDNLKKLEMPELIHEDTLKTILDSAAVMNSLNMFTFQRSEYRLLDLSDIYPISSVNGDITLGLKCSAHLLAFMATPITQILEDYASITSLLKKKPWRENGPDTDLEVFGSKLIDATLGILSLGQLYGATPYSIYVQYINKAILNIERQNNNY
jgi:NTP pyrophosphatase (non-canonical NTP hydrolase)